MSKYDELTQNLTVAVNEAKKAAETTDDGSTCNFDCCLLYLPRYNEEKTIEAIQAAGVGGFKSNFLGKVCYMLGNPIFAQGNQRTVQAEKIAEVMKLKGYDVDIYYQMD